MILLLKSVSVRAFFTTQNAKTLRYMCLPIRTDTGGYRCRTLTKTNYKTDEYGKRSRHRFSPAWLIHILIYYLRRIAVVFRETLNSVIEVDALTHSAHRRRHSSRSERTESLHTTIIIRGRVGMPYVAQIRTWRLDQFSLVDKTNGTIATA